MRLRFRLGSFLIAMFFCLTFESPSQATEIVGNNEMAAYLGTGGLLLPSSFAGSATAKTQVSNCNDCVWAYTVFCMYTSEGLCKHSTASCSSGQIRYRVWFGQTRQTMQLVGSVCWGSGRPLTRHNLENEIRSTVIKYVPALDLQIAPPGGTLTFIPVIGWTNQSSAYRPPAFEISGHLVTLEAVASWRWIWGDGSLEWKVVPGQPYPQNQISHRYRIPGNYLVQVSTHWQATYSIVGFGMYPVSGEQIVQSDSLEIRVLTASSVRVKRSS